MTFQGRVFTTEASKARRLARGRARNRALVKLAQAHPEDKKALRAKSKKGSRNVSTVYGSLRVKYPQEFRALYAEEKARVGLADAYLGVFTEHGANWQPEDGTEGEQ